MKSIVTVALALALGTASVTASAQTAGRRTLLIGSGEVTGYYFPAAGALCRVLNKERPDDRGCAVTPSSGSAANVDALRTGQADLAILQSRAALAAVSGSDGFDKPYPELRALLSLHGEQVVILAREGSEISSLADLKGKRVNLGRPGSFQRAMADLALDAAGISQGELAPVVELDLSEQTPELCEGNIDAAVYTGVHPMPEVASAIEECNATLVPLKAKALEGYLKEHAWLSRSAIRPGTYAGVKDEVASVSLKAVLVTTTLMTEDEVRDIMRAIHANFTALTRLHPVLKGLGKGDSAHDGIAIPLHDGAKRFYTEAGIR